MTRQIVGSHLRIVRLRRGGLMFEMLVYLSLFAAFAATAGGLIVESMSITATAEHGDDGRLRLESAIRQLRTDVWSARAIAADGAGVTIHEPDGRQLRWELRPDPIPPTASKEPRTATLCRRIPGQPAAIETAWDRMPAAIEFVVDGPVLQLRISGKQFDQVTVVSETMLAGGQP